MLSLVEKIKSLPEEKIIDILNWMYNHTFEKDDFDEFLKHRDLDGSDYFIVDEKDSDGRCYGITLENSESWYVGIDIDENKVYEVNKNLSMIVNGMPYYSTCFLTSNDINMVLAKIRKAKLEDFN
jgi:hypothetical protein